MLGKKNIYKILVSLNIIKKQWFALQVTFMANGNHSITAR